jgi:hypothetical protein
MVILRGNIDIVESFSGSLENEIKPSVIKEIEYLRL